MKGLKNWCFLLFIMFSASQILAMSKGNLEGKSVVSGFSGVKVKHISQHQAYENNTKSAIEMVSYLSELSNKKPVVLTTYYSFCAICQKMATYADQKLEKAGIDAYVVSLLLGGIGKADDRSGFESIEKWKAANDENFLGDIALYDDQNFYNQLVLEKHGLEGTPDFFVIFKGQVLFHHHGYILSSNYAPGVLAVNLLNSLQLQDPYYDTYKFHNNDGQLFALSYAFFKGKRHGKWDAVYKDKHIKTTEYYNGLYEGVSTLYYENGKPRKEFWYHNDEFTGKLKVYYESGALMQEQDATGAEKTTVQKVYSETGSLYAQGSALKIGTWHGEWKTYWDNGQVNEIVNYDNGQKDGPGVFYHDNGKVAQKGLYQKDKEQGVWLIYHTNGQLYQKRQWKDGLLMEILECFDQDGMALPKGTLNNGNGTVNYYEPDGTFQSTKQYKDGELVSE
ncbi:MAG: toxin-antitoxin system YwqK family antitoxin [Bacteroidetes bacterium]|nr:toxin-antitoxin system YwqK family antitoxin [Bacteroidota bacterium]